jgi:2-keto-4-pentenoate hydratase/2-oxohepta-3-ene-1,7-dioic acid hydratase in catechol pathway
VLGYTVGNDVSARDLQRSGIGFDLFSSKSLDKTTGLGPWIVTRDEFGDGTPDIGMSLKVNGETRQNARTGEMTWKLDVILPYVDQRAALQTGDVVFTGTPEGVAWASGRFLKPGDLAFGSKRAAGSGRLCPRIVQSDECDDLAFRRGAGVFHQPHPQSLAAAAGHGGGNQLLRHQRPEDHA